jgi:hypothetical protein
MTYGNDGRLPIIYVRGYAGSGAEKDSAVDDPFYGFSQGSVHVRANRSGRPQFHQFESPMLRLVTDHEYQVPVYGDQRAFLHQARAGAVNSATIWIHRFYDESASTFGERPADFSLEGAARDLFMMIKLVILKTGAPKVFLVAHSMGGLICRAAIQRIIPESTAAEDGTINPAAGAEYVARFFTYATPHGGILFAVGFGIPERVRDLTGFLGADVFGPDRMYEYLTPGVGTNATAPAGFTGTAMPDDGFPVDRVFCLVGSNPDDYGVAHGLASKAVGARSDGLVQIENAAVNNAHRAVIHRSHSGRYGIVNSEEGYQNLQRFLFGDLEIAVQFAGLDAGRDSSAQVEFQLDVGLAIRGLPVLMHEQSAAHYCPVLVERKQGRDSIDTPTPLFTTFLSSKAPRPMNGLEPVPTLRYAVKLRLLSIREDAGRFLLFDHLEQTEDWQDALLVDVEPADATASAQVWAAWTSTVPTAVREWQPQEADRVTDRDGTARRWRGEVPVPEVARRLLGETARIDLTVTPRSVPA